MDTILEICGAINVPLFLGCALHHINIQLDSGTLSLCALLTSLPSYDFLAYDRIIFFCLECVTNNGMISEISIPLCVTNVQSIIVMY